MPRAYGRAAMILVLLAATQSASGAPYQADIAAAEIQGRVTGAGTEVVMGAQVTVTDPATSFSRTVISDEGGFYRVLQVPPGRYEVEVEATGFVPTIVADVRVTVGQTRVLDLELASEAAVLQIEVVAAPLITEPGRTSQSTTIVEEYVRNLPIERRDYLTYTLLAPGIVDAEALADANDFRVVQTRTSGFSFYGNNGRGNSVSVDGGESNTSGGGVRLTLSQEAVQEFQINRSSYSAEFGYAGGGAINIITKSGTNGVHGSAYGFFGNQALNAANPFARALVGGTLRRVDPAADREQFGATLGGPIIRNQTFYFASFEGLRRRESNAVVVLTDPAIFEPTAQQEAVLAQLPSAQAAALRAVLTSPQQTRDLFAYNSGVFPFQSDGYKGSLRLDQNFGPRDQGYFRYDYASLDETNPNTLALVGRTRGHEFDQLDHTGALGWSHQFVRGSVNSARVQFNYSTSFVDSLDPFGPEININGFGHFNRDSSLPSHTISRRFEATDGLTLSGSAHSIKLGGQFLLRGVDGRAEALLGGRFDFGSLPGSIVSPALATTTITSLQAFNLGLAQIYQQGFGEPGVGSTHPFVGLYVQDSWLVRPDMQLNLGIRYEVDDRRDPLPTDVNNVGPRLGFSWSPGEGYGTVVRSGYGVFYTPHYYQIDWVANALNDVNGRRQIAQVLTTLLTPGAANSANIFNTLRQQGVLTFPTSTATISEQDLGQFGIAVVHEGPLPPFSALFGTAPDLKNAYTQQASLEVEREITPNTKVTAAYLFSQTKGVVRARDTNLLPAPIDPTLGIRVWSDPYFLDPFLLQNNVYESTGAASYHGFVVELEKRFIDGIGFHVHYTLSKAIDDVVDFNSGFQANDQANLAAEKALSSFDQRHKFVAYGIFQSPFQNPLLKGFDLTPVVRANSGRPFNLLAGFDLNGDRHSDTDRPAGAGRNTGIGPAFWTLDLRLTRRVAIAEGQSLELIAEGFNVLNKLNHQSVNNVVGNISGPFDLHGTSDLSPTEPLGFTSAHEPRRLQLGARFSF